MANWIWLLLFVALVWIGRGLVNTSPLAAWSLAVGMLVLGVTSVIVSLIQVKRFQKTFDYEPAQFLGKPSNGKKIRGVLTAVLYFGLWASVGGVFLGALILIGIE
jgi:uncharacterized membrane protein